MLRTSAYRLRVRTGCADQNALILLSDGELVAVLVELTDEIHGDERGKWTVEALFGLGKRYAPGNFASEGDAADWVSDQVGSHPFLLGESVALLG